MSSYIFRQSCRPRGDFRVMEIMQFLHLMREALRCPTLYDSRNRPVQLTPSGLQNIFERNIDKLFPGIGVNVDFFTIPPKKRDDDTVAIEIHTGTHRDEIFVDNYNVSMSDSRKVPDFNYFKKSIEILKPFEAFLAEDNNESVLDAYNRQQRIPRFDKPAIIRGFHYLDEFMSRSIGGIDYCLKAPAWKVQRFCEGVLIQLVPGLFDSTNPEHLLVQHIAMEYFGLL